MCIGEIFELEWLADSRFPFRNLNRWLKIAFLKRNKLPAVREATCAVQGSVNVVWTTSPYCSASYPRPTALLTVHSAFRIYIETMYRHVTPPIGGSGDVLLGGFGNRREASRGWQLTSGPAPFIIYTTPWSWTAQHPFSSIHKGHPDVSLWLPLPSVLLTPLTRFS